MSLPNIILLITNQATACGKEVVFAIYFTQTSDSLTFHEEVHRTIIGCTHTICQTVAHTILVEVEPLSMMEIIDLANTIVTSHAKALVKEVPLSVDFPPSPVMVTRTIVVSVTVKGIYPNTRGKLTIFFEVVVNTTNHDCAANSCHGRTREIVPFIVDLLPAASQNAKVGITVQFTFLEHAAILHLILTDTILTEVIVELIGRIRGRNLLHTSQQNTVSIVAIIDPTVGHNNAVLVCLTVSVDTSEQITADTLQDAVNEIIAVAGCGNNSTPINHRTAAIVSITLSAKVLNRTACTTDTEYTTSVTGVGTGSSQILRITGGVNMEAPLALSVNIGVVAIHFGLNHSFIGREGHDAAIQEGHNTCFSTNYQSIVSSAVGVPHSMRSQNVVLVLLTGIIGNIILTDAAVIQPTLCSPNTNGQLSQDSGISNLIADAGKGDHCVIMDVYVVFSLEAISNFHAFQFPIVDIVKIDGGSHRLDFCQVISNEIHPVDRICGQ